MNNWLDPLIKNYLYYFGATDKPVVWDVGSRDGDDGVEIGKRIYAGQPNWFWTNAKVVAVEPNPAGAALIRKRHPEVRVLELAASNVRGSAPFVVYSGDPGAVGSSSLDLNWKKELKGKNITVKTDRLDSLIGDSKIDIMKIDVEGHCLETVEGLGDKLKQIKVYHIETDNFTDSNIKMKAFMMAHGFTLVDEVEQYGGFPDQVWVQS